MSKEKHKEVFKLKNKHHMMFVIEYMKTFDIIESYMKVYECSRENAYGNAYRVYNRDDVQEAINSIIVKDLEEAEELRVSKGRIVNEIAKIALGNYPPKSKLDALNMLGRATGVLVEGNMRNSLDESFKELNGEESKEEEEM